MPEQEKEVVVENETEDNGGHPDPKKEEKQ